MSTQSNLGLYNSGTYIPFICDITDITRAENAVLTTSATHGFVPGNTVQFFVPQLWGMRQIDGMKGNVLSVTSTTFTVTIDTRTFNAFVTPTPSPSIMVIDPAQVAPIGDTNIGYITPAGSRPDLQIPGTFRNTYP